MEAMFRTPRAALAAALLQLAVAASAEAREAKYYAVVHNGTSDCSTSGETLESIDDMLQAWHGKMLDKGWTDGGHYVDNNINQARFVDPDWADSVCVPGSLPGCTIAGTDSTNGIDEGDAVMIGTHGSDVGEKWCGYLRYKSGTNLCVACGGTDGWVRFGDADAEFAHLVSCHSMDDDNMPYMQEMLEDPVDSPVNGQRAHVLTGFHGTTAESEARTRSYRSVASDGFSGDVASAWMDNLWDSYVCYDEGCGYEVCPVAYAIGATEDGCDDHLLNDGYGDPGSDPDGSSHYCYLYYEGCTPDDEYAFNPPED